MSNILKDPADDIPTLPMPEMTFDDESDVHLKYEGGDDKREVLGMPTMKFDPAKPPTRRASDSDSASFAGTSEDELMNSTTKNVQTW